MFRSFSLILRLSRPAMSMVSMLLSSTTVPSFLFSSTTIPSKVISRFRCSSVRSSLKRFRRCGGAGGIIRDLEGMVVMAFAQPLSQITSAYRAETRALSLGLRIARQAGFVSLEIESDCKELVTRIQQAEIDPRPASMLAEEIRIEFASFLNACIFKFVPRICNKAADALPN